MGADLEKLRKEYRPSMDKEVLHSWATDVVAALSAAAQPGQVKELEWHDSEPGHTNGYNGRRIVESARVSFGAYFIEHSQDDDTWWLLDGLIGPVIAGPFNEAWDARGAAQSDFEAKVFACLLPTTRAGECSDAVAKRLKRRIDYRLNDALIEMKPEQDDSITGFNEAWDIVSRILNEELGLAIPSPAQGTVERAREVAWLIERKDNAVFQQPHWYHEEPSGWHWWTRDANEAKRFASRAEAQAYHAYQAVASDPAITITEHMWINDGFSWSHGRASPLREENERLKAKIESLEDNGTRLSDMLIEASQSERDDD